MSSRFPMALGLLYLWAFLCLVFMTELHALALLLLPIAAVAFWQRERWPMSKTNAGLGIGGSLLLTVVIWQTSSTSGYLLGVGSLALAFFAAGTCISFTLLRSTEETRLAIPGLCGFLLVTCTMSTQLKPVVVVGLVGTVLLALALRERQGLRLSARQLIPILIIGMLTAVLAVSARWSETRLSYLLQLFAMVPASGIRFPPSSSLDSLQRYNFSDIVVLRVYGNEAPPYMVGRSFVTYDNTNSWLWKPTKQEIRPTSEIPSPARPGLTYQVYPSRAGLETTTLGQPVIVEFPDGGSGFTFYTPRHFLALATDLDRIHRYSDGLWQALALDSFSGTYALYAHPNGWVSQGQAEELSPEEREKHLALPSDLTPEIARLAEEVAGPYAEPEEKAERITTFFQTKFEYGYDYPFEKGDRSVLEQFLVKRPPVHCEFFATAAALMLRSQGVPTRYINGFVVQERSFDDSYFVVRLKHAHAWLEAYLPGKGWTTFDPTPPGVLESPQTQNPSALRGILEWLSNGWRQFVSWFRLSPMQMVESFKAFLTSRSSGQWLGLLGSLIAVWGLRRYLTRRGRKRLKKTPSTAFTAGRHDRLTPLLEALQEGLDPVWRRQDWETPGQWVDRLATSTIEQDDLSRLRSAVARYQAARYGHPFSDTEFSYLETELKDLRRQAFEGKSLETREPAQP